MFSISSSIFRNEQEIPKKYTAEGEDQSPPLVWRDVPPKTQELALICDDPDAPRAEPWVHWVIYGLQPTIQGLSENIPLGRHLDHPVMASQGKNSSDKIGYTGPMPPKGHGWHRYFFKLYALDSHLKVPPGITKDQLIKAMEGHILGQTEIIGKYKRD